MVASVRAVLRRFLPFLLAAVAALACAAPAAADTLTDSLKDYVNDQRLDPCKYTQKQLSQLKDLIPNDANAYAADFVAAVDDALASRAQGACNKKGNATPQDTTDTPDTGGGAAAPPSSGGNGPASGAPSGADSTPAAPNTVKPPPTPTVQPTASPEVAIRDAIGIAASTTDPATDAPFPVLALAILAGLFALAGLVVALVRWRAWEPQWADDFRHAAGEAGWRASSTWAEFTDFVRFGR